MELADVTGGSVAMLIAGCLLVAGTFRISGAASLGGLAYCTDYLTRGRW